MKPDQLPDDTTSLLEGLASALATEIDLHYEDDELAACYADIAWLRLFSSVFAQRRLSTPEPVLHILRRYKASVPIM